ncbi:hypothetical protein cyc_04775 [Cyclospora cayetanensis]|uniref:Uncharacterized protein n=1 Tax=Cyclospora cayetanensis TaxID=88456 RepID=A0A1D3CVY6_9EIME|nr:hypothetical protein cyc_04775 [Cyclospora cayetanensis]
MSHRSLLRRCILSLKRQFRSGFVWGTTVVLLLVMGLLYFPDPVYCREAEFQGTKNEMAMEVLEETWLTEQATDPYLLISGEGIDVLHPPSMSSRHDAEKRASVKRASVIFATSLLIGSILTLYGATLRKRAKELARVQGRQAAVDRDALEASQKKHKESLNLSRELAEQLTKIKSEIEAINAETEAISVGWNAKELKLMELQSQETVEQAKASSQAQSVARQEREYGVNTETLLEHLKSRMEGESPRSVLMEEAYDARRRLVEKNREISNKIEELKLLELRSGHGVAAGGTSLEQIEFMEMQLKPLKLQGLEHMEVKEERDGLAKSIVAKEELKEGLLERIEDLGRDLNARKVAEESRRKDMEQQKPRIDELEKQYQETKASVDERKKLMSGLAHKFETRKEKFLRTLALLEKRVETEAKSLPCIGTCKDPWEVLRRKDEIVSYGLLCDALEQHKNLEAREKQLAGEEVKRLQEGLKKELAELDTSAEKEALGAEEQQFLEQWKKYLNANMQGAQEKAHKEARYAEAELLLLLKTRGMEEYKASLAVRDYFGNLYKDHQEEEFIATKLLQANAAYEEKRLALLSSLDLASSLAQDRDLAEEIRKLVVLRSKPQAIVDEEKQRLEAEIKETKKKRDTVSKRRLVSRRGLQSIKNFHDAKPTDEERNGNSCISLKLRLQGDLTLLNLYTLRLERLESKKKTLDTIYPDKLTRAKEEWEALSQDILDIDARARAAGIFNEQCEETETTRLLKELEGYTGEALDTEGLALLGVMDDPKLSDDYLLSVPEVGQWNLVELLKTKGGATSEGDSVLDTDRA